MFLVWQGTDLQDQTCDYWLSVVKVKPSMMIWSLLVPCKRGGPLAWCVRFAGQMISRTVEGRRWAHCFST